MVDFNYPLSHIKNCTDCYFYFLVCFLCCCWPGLMNALMNALMLEIFAFGMFQISTVLGFASILRHTSHFSSLHF